MGASGWNLTASLPQDMSLCIELSWVMKGELDGSVGDYGHINPRQASLVLSVFWAPPLKKPFVSSPIVPPSCGGWHHVSSWWVSIVGTQGLEPYPPFYTSLCFLSQSLISQHVCVLVGSTGPGWGVQGGLSLGHNLQGGHNLNNQGACFAIWSALPCPWLTKDPYLWWHPQWTTVAQVGSCTASKRARPNLYVLWRSF